MASTPKAATPKERVLARYPKAWCAKHPFWTRYIVINTLANNEWRSTAVAAWADASRRLRGRGKGEK
jgi:hypothetical protein